MADTWKEVVIVIILLVIFVIAVFGILGLRRNLAKPPTLDVAMEDVTYTDQEKVTITGKTDKDTEIMVDGEGVPTDNEGNFSFEKELKEGENKVRIEAKKGEKFTTVEKTVVLQIEKDVNGANNIPGENPANGDLNNTGPAENILGTFGLLAILFAYRYYTKSKKLRLNF